MERLKPKTLEIDTIIGHRVKEARERLGISQRELAMRAGFTHSYISKIEGGYQGAESRSMRIIADCLMVSYNWLIHGEDHEDAHGHGLRAEVLNPVEHAIIKIIRELPSELPHMILAQLEGLNAHLARLDETEESPQPPPSSKKHSTPSAPAPVVRNTPATKLPPRPR